MSSKVVSRYTALVEKILIFTDGSSRGNPGPGGWGAIVVTETTAEELGGYEANTTNNRMELTAVFEALRHVSSLPPAAISLYTDSAYVMNGALKWGKGWRARSWMTIENKEVLNRDLWEPFLTLLDSLPHTLEWHNVGGHIGIAGNERVDAIATSYALQENVELYKGSRGSYSVDVTNLSIDHELHAKKKEARSRSKLPAYSYVSLVDGEIKTHKTWAECEARTKGKKARYKKATSPSEEAEIIQEFSR